MHQENDISFTEKSIRGIATGSPDTGSNTENNELESSGRSTLLSSGWNDEAVSESYASAHTLSSNETVTGMSSTVIASASNETSLGGSLAATDPSILHSSTEELSTLADTSTVKQFAISETRSPGKLVIDKLEDLTTPAASSNDFSAGSISTTVQGKSGDPQKRDPNEGSFMSSNTSARQVDDQHHGTTPGTTDSHPLKTTSSTSEFSNKSNTGTTAAIKKIGNNGNSQGEPDAAPSSNRREIFTATNVPHRPSSKPTSKGEAGGKSTTVAVAYEGSRSTSSPTRRGHFKSPKPKLVTTTGKVKDEFSQNPDNSESSGNLAPSFEPMWSSKPTMKIPSPSRLTPLSKEKPSIPRRPPSIVDIPPGQEIPSLVLPESPPSFPNIPSFPPFQIRRRTTTTTSAPT